MRMLFDQVLRMNLSGSWVILLVLLARLPLRKAPARFRYLLWALVLLRLLCPLSPESRMSMMPEPQQISVNTYTPDELSALPAAASPTGAVHPGDPPITAPVPLTLPAIRRAALRTLRAVWPLGTSLLLAGSLLSLLRLRRKLAGAVPLRDHIWLADHLDTAFVLGIFRPRIYLPSSLPPEEQDYILLHEQTHLRRRDPLWKLLGFLTLCVHWFNPLVWAAMRCAERDMELSCDEAVLAQLGPEIRQAYASSLLRLAAGRSAGVAFGETGTKARIMNVLHYQRPKQLISLAAATVVILLTCGLLTNPVTAKPAAPPPQTYSVHSIVYENLHYSFGYTLDTAPEYAIISYPDDENGSLMMEYREGNVNVSCTADEIPLADFAAHFRLDPASLPDGFEPSAFLRDTVRVWTFHDIGNTSQWLIQQDDGQLFVARSLGSESIRWLYALGTPSPDGVYEVREIISHWLLSSVFRREPEGQYAIIGSNLFSLSTSGRSAFCGALRETTLVEEPFYSLFGLTSIDREAQQALFRENQHAWRAEQASRFYLLLLQEDGTLCLLEGNPNTKVGPDETAPQAEWAYILSPYQTAPQPTPGVYVAEGFLYDDPAANFTYKPENAPVYTILSTGLVLAEGSIGNSIIGLPEEVTLTERNFDLLFTAPDVVHGITLPEIRESAEKAWLMQNNDEFHYLIRLSGPSGTLLLASGYRTNNVPTHIRWLFRLAPADMQVDRSTHSVSEEIATMDALEAYAAERAAAEQEAIQKAIGELSAKVQSLTGNAAEIPPETPHGGTGAAATAGPVP